MNRTKIEEIDQLLINAFKMGASTGIKGSYVVEVENWLPNFKDANKALLTSLLAEDGGEVKGWTNVMSGLPKADGRYLIYYEYRKRPEIRKYFIADYSVTDGWLSTLNDIYIIGWKEIEEFNTTPSQHTKGEGV